MPRVAINGFGRIGRLALRAAHLHPEFEVVHINEAGGDVAMAAHLLQFDSIHGRWSERDVEVVGDKLHVGDAELSYSQTRDIAAIPWHLIGADIVIESTGAFRTSPALETYFEAGLSKVVVAAPVKDGPLNVVMGVNDDRYDPETHHLITAASCTTNCIAPVVEVVHGEFGIRHGTITTIHDITNTQRVLDGFHKDPRRARESGTNLIPTTTGSATAIAEIFPELRGRLNGVAVRVPITNASLTDCVFELERSATEDALNEALETAAGGRLQGILGVERRPLVSSDYRSDPRSGIVDAGSTQVVDGTLAKLLVWYDNEMGYARRLMELVAKVARSLPAA
ncbi:MAG: ArsJ-associated glyceraldehyde-3-phosphate dehydrogenase [Pseudomonadota bacterium]